MAPGFFRAAHRLTNWGRAVYYTDEWLGRHFSGGGNSLRRLFSQRGQKYFFIGLAFAVATVCTAIFILFDPRGTAHQIPDTRYRFSQTLSNLFLLLPIYCGALLCFAKARRLVHVILCLWINVISIVLLASYRDIDLEAIETWMLLAYLAFAYSSSTVVFAQKNIRVDNEHLTNYLGCVFSLICLLFLCLFILAPKLPPLYDNGGLRLYETFSVISISFFSAFLLISGILVLFLKEANKKIRYLYILIPILTLAVAIVADSIGASRHSPIGVFGISIWSYYLSATTTFLVIACRKIQYLYRKMTT